MKQIVLLALALLSVFTITGCRTKTQYIGPGQAQIIGGFNQDDIDAAINAAVTSILTLDRIKVPAGSNRAIIAINNVQNDTLSRGRDAEALAEALGISLRSYLTNCGKVIVYNAQVGQYATQQVAVQYTLYGRLTQRNLRQDDGDIQIEYNLNLQLVENATGLEFWQQQIPIRKLADRRNAF